MQSLPERYNALMQSHRLIIRCLIAVALCPAFSHAALPPIEPYVFSKSALSERVSQVTAYHVYQDASGFLWVLTQEGLNRFDGKENIVFRSDINTLNSLSNDNLTGVAEDSEGNLWFSTAEGGLNKFRRSTHTFAVYRAEASNERSPLSDRIATLHRGLSGNLWIGYQDGGFSWFHPKLGTFQHFTESRYPSLGDAPVTHILEAQDGTVLVATNGNGVFRLHLQPRGRASLEKMSFDYASQKISLIVKDSKDNIWIGSFNAGVSLKESSGDTIHFSATQETVSGKSVEIKGVYDVFEDSSGEIFLATDAGILRYDRPSVQLIPIPIRNSSSSRQRIYSIIQDGSGRYWAGGYKGVFSGFKSGFTTVNRESGLPAENVLSITSLNNGALAIGTSDGLYTTSEQGDFLHAFETPAGFAVDSPVTSLLKDKNFFWVGTFDSGLHKVNLKSGETRHYLPNEKVPGSIGHNKITALFKDQDQNLWVGTFNGGLSRLRHGADEFDHFVHSSEDSASLSDNTVYAIYQERNGDLWIGTNNGLNRFNFDTGTFDRFMHDREKPGALSSRVVFSIHEDEKARLWVGTQGGGLNMWEPVDRKSSRNKFQYFQSNIRLPSSTIYAIQGDDEDNIWLSTSGGLTRFNYETGEAKNFTVDDGLQSNDFNLGASHRDSAGNLYFGGTSGLNIFNPRSIRSNSIPPRIALTRVSLGNEQVWFDTPYSQLERIELQHDDYMLGFAFAALDFTAPARNTYRYQMVGLDKNWVALGNRNTIDFSKLPMGEYVLRIQGANPDGVWSTEDLALDIVVHPPFYLTWYAFVSYFLVAVALVLSFLFEQRRREQRQLEYQAQLEADVRAATRDLRRSNEKLQFAVDEIDRAREEAVEANQAKSDFLAALSHEIRTPMHGVLGMTDLLLHSGLSERQQDFAQSAQKSANELLGLIDNILDFSKIESGKLELEEITFNLREELENLCYLYAELAQARNLELNLVFNARLRRQLYGDPVRLRQILQNLLSNAIKFTRRGGVNLVVNELSRKEKTVELEFLVEDTGIGMDKDTIARVFEAFSQADSSTTRQYGGTGLGLSIAKQLVELMSGVLTVRSRPGVGTTMRVALSLNESPIYTDQLAAGRLKEFRAEVVSSLPETRAMFRTQLEAMDLRVRECASVEELAPVADHPRLVLVDVACLYDGSSIAQVANIADSPNSRILLVTPLSGDGVPRELSWLPHTTKPSRSATLVNDILSVDAEAPVPPEKTSALLRFDKRVLLVEDIAANQEIAKAMLESFGCSVAVAGNGEVALELFQQDDYDLILMDCQMPVMDGFETTRCIRQFELQHYSSTRTPVVALTAGKTETEKERCFASGMDKIMFKPYSTEQLNKTLAQYIEPCGEIEQARTRPAQKPTPRVPVSTPDILDEQALENIRSIDVQGGFSLLSSVFENFKTDATKKVEELRANRDDKAILGAGAHAIKSMALNLGAKALSEYCRACEVQWKEGDIADAPRQIEVMAGHLRDAIRALQQNLEAQEEVL